MANLLDVEGIGPVNAEKLKKAGVGSTDSLLKAIMRLSLKENDCVR